MTHILACYPLTTIPLTNLPPTVPPTSALPWLRPPQEGRPFSEVVLTAKGLGYTEPDPRDDLGGVDVARKALILARCLGLELELHQVLYQCVLYQYSTSTYSTLPVRTVLYQYVPVLYQYSTSTYSTSTYQCVLYQYVPVRTLPVRTSTYSTSTYCATCVLRPYLPWPHVLQPHMQWLHVLWLHRLWLHRPTICRLWWSLHLLCVGGGGAYTYYVQVVVEPLYPPELATLSVADFMAKLPSLDEGFAQRVAAATRAGKVWRHPRPPYVLTAVLTRPQLPTDDAILTYLRAHTNVPPCPLHTAPVHVDGPSACGRETTYMARMSTNHLRILTNTYEGAALRRLCRARHQQSHGRPQGGARLR